MGRHLLLELYDCSSEALNSLESVKSAMVEAAKRAEATIIDVVFHEFNPFGISGVVVIAESHLSIHTWPEHRYAAVDIFSCGDALKPAEAANYLVEQFGASRASCVEVKRGVFRARPDWRTGSRRASPPMAPQSPYKWFFETTTSVEGHAHAIVRTLFALRTEFQQMEILETASYGKCLVLDGRIQSSVADDFIYHETLVHPAMVLHPRPESALVIGGGEGATLREILRYPVHPARSHGRHRRPRGRRPCRATPARDAPGRIRRPSHRARHEDARGWLERTSERFDVAIVDLTEPSGGRAGLPPVHPGVLPAPERPPDAPRHAGAPGRHDRSSASWTSTRR